MFEMIVLQEEYWMRKGIIIQHNDGTVKYIYIYIYVLRIVALYKEIQLEFAFIFVIESSKT